MCISPLVRLALLSSAFCAGLNQTLAAQGASKPRLLCWKAAQGASCHAVLLTNFGAYASIGSRLVGAVDPFTGAFSEQRRVAFSRRFTGDLGLLFDLGRRDAVGISVLGSAEISGFGGGFELAGFARYRRWLEGSRSLDLALGMPVVLRSADALRAPYGLVKLNLNGRLGIALRPEVHRACESTNGLQKKSRFYLSAGVELGEKPGLVLSALGGTLLGLVAIILLHFSD